MDCANYIKNNITPMQIENILIKFGSKIYSSNDEQIVCTCPIHHGTHYNFTYYLSNNYWKCHKEDIGGDIFTLYEIIYEVDFKTAISLVAQELGLDISSMTFENRKQDYLLEINRWLNYIDKKEEEQEKYNLYKVGTRVKINRYRHLTKETLEHFNVFFSKSYCRIVFPIDNIGASLRAYKNAKPKWLHVPKGLKTGQILYNLQEVISLGYREVFIVEGIIDVLSLYQLGIKNVVCTFGARITEQQIRLLMNFDTIILAFDNDETGQYAIKKAIENYKYLINIKVLILNEQKDVGEIKTIEEFKECKIVDYKNFK